MYQPNASFSRYFIFFALALVISIGSGCVAGQSIRLAHTAPAGIMGEPGKDVQVIVKDERPYIKTGEKKPDYIGHYRAGFGNTWAVTNAGNLPLAQQFENDLKMELASLGLNTIAQSKRQLVVRILEFNFDTYMNGKIWYDIKIEVADSGRVLAEDALSENNVIQGSVWVGPKYAFEKEVPAIYSRIIRKMVRENPAILAALKS